MTIGYLSIGNKIDIFIHYLKEEFYLVTSFSPLRKMSEGFSELAQEVKALALSLKLSRSSEPKWEKQGTSFDKVSSDLQVHTQTYICAGTHTY